MYSEKYVEIRRLSPIAIAIAFALLSLGSLATVAAYQQIGKASITAQSAKIDLGMGQASKKNYTFDLGNQWYPGKSDTISLNVYNSGNLPMKYSVASSLVSESLVNQIDVVARINGSVVYEGKMSEISIPLRTLNKNSSESIDFSLTWPYVEANALTDYSLQGMTVSNTLVFTANN